MSSKNNKRVPKPRVSLTKKQVQDGIGAELFALCQTITADGKLSKGEIIELGRWLRGNKDSELAGLVYLSEVFEKIVADGRVNPDEHRELLEAIEMVLPSEARKLAKTARKAVEAEKKAKGKAAQMEMQRQELEREERRQPEDEFDFMVAGVHAEGRGLLVERWLTGGDRVRLVPEPDNPHDEYAVAVTLTDGRQIGYVPRTDSADVSMCIDDGGYFVATVKKLLTRASPPRPVVEVQFYRQDQFQDIADLAPDRSPRVSLGDGRLRQDLASLQTAKGSAQGTAGIVGTVLVIAFLLCFAAICAWLLR